MSDAKEFGMDELMFTGARGTGSPDPAARDGFFRVAAATPKIRVADVQGNAEAVLAWARSHCRSCA